MVENEDVSKLTAGGLRGIKQTFLHMRLLASPSNWCDQRRALIYQLADAMHNVPQALEIIATNEGCREWAIEELEEFPGRLQALWAANPDLP